MACPELKARLDFSGLAVLDSFMYILFIGELFSGERMACLPRIGGNQAKVVAAFFS